MLRICLLFVFLAIAHAQTPGFSISTDTQYTLIDQLGNSKLFVVNGSFEYAHAPMVIDLHGSRYEQGFAYGKMLGKNIPEVYNTFTSSLVPKKFLTQVIFALVEVAIDYQWDKFLSKQVPLPYMEELQGIADGCKAAGYPMGGRYVTRVVLLANAPGDIENFIYIILRELDPKMVDGLIEKGVLAALSSSDSSESSTHTGFMCSMFAAWGSRTEDGSLWSARNLDWTKNTGINQWKLITVHHPDDGGHAHADIGFVGMWGALAGLSAAGLSVHEANLEEKQIGFSGFPWVLRLRYIMEKASNLAEAHALWAATNNTVGFNHMVASEPDRQALVMETMYGYTAYFNQDDPREASAVYVDPKTNVSSPIGAPMREALFRTNHGYDPTIRENYLWSQSPDADSIKRYFYISDAFEEYAAEGTRIGLLQAVNITSIVGDKGRAHPYTCMENTDGSNVMSVVFHPYTLQLYAAWERNSGTAWRPACCSTYIQFDMNFWFGA